MQNKFVKILTVIALLWGASGCSSLSPTLITQEDLAPVERNNAYVIVGQKLVTDRIYDKAANLTHMAMAMHVNGDMIKPIKGIYLPQSELPSSLFQNSPYHEFLMANTGGHTYRVWPIPGKYIQQESRAVIFTNMVASKDGFFIPFHSTLSFKVSNGVAPLEKGKNTHPYSTFLANAFIIDRPGIYYLGEMNLTGALKMLNGLTFNKQRDSQLDWKTDVTKYKEELATYLKDKGLNDLPIHDLSQAWRELPMDELTGYKAGDKELTFQKVQ